VAVPWSEYAVFIGLQRLEGRYSMPNIGCEFVWVQGTALPRVRGEQPRDLYSRRALARSARGVVAVGLP